MIAIKRFILSLSLCILPPGKAMILYQMRRLGGANPKKVNIHATIQGGTQPKTKKSRDSSRKKKYKRPPSGGGNESADQQRGSSFSPAKPRLSV
jgi:hypothetical protein